MNDEQRTEYGRYIVVAFIIGMALVIAWVASGTAKNQTVAETPAPTSPPRPIESRTETRLCDFTTIKAADMTFVICDDGMEFTIPLDPTLEPSPIP